MTRSGAGASLEDSFRPERGWNGLRRLFPLSPEAAEEAFGATVELLLELLDALIF